MIKWKMENEIKEKQKLIIEQIEKYVIWFVFIFILYDVDVW